MLTSFSTIFLLHLGTSLVFFIPPIESTLSHTSLLEQICRQSPHYHLCVMTLRSSIHHRSKADVAGFARLTLEIAYANASVTIENIRKVYVQIRDNEQKGVLEDCFASYNRIVKVHLREALNAMGKSDYKVARQRVYAAGIQAESCNSKIKNPINFPLRDTNRYMINLCAISLSIIDKLLQTNQPNLTPNST
ncbi:hypothetical protein VNO77_05597 [Canavalia gladiata]|uniref:Pectinesterase inhibitor domain-containing protein n=1 Tax=Canavalia gladiata TaxID=3824 RepID=A0AAN9REA6_CANGL